MFPADVFVWTCTISIPVVLTDISMIAWKGMTFTQHSIQYLFLNGFFYHSPMQDTLSSSNVVFETLKPLILTFHPDSHLNLCDLFVDD